MNANYKYFVVNEGKLRKYATLKSDVDKGIFKRPDNEFLLTNHQKPAPNFNFAKIDNAEAEPTNA